MNQHQERQHTLQEGTLVHQGLEIIKQSEWNYKYVYSVHRYDEISVEARYLKQKEKVDLRYKKIKFYKWKI